MLKWAIGWIFVFCAVLAACGPKTIFVRPSLDTPDRHIANGYMLLNQDKAEGASREFKRANELDPQNVEALVGLALSLAHRGDLEQGMTIMKKASDQAVTAKDKAAVQKGYQQMEMLRLRNTVPATQN